MTYFVQRNSRISGPLPRPDILAVCAYLNRGSPAVRGDTRMPDPETVLNRLAAAAGMQ